MHKYVLKRLLMLIPVILGVTFVVFFILNLAPGDPAAIILGDQATAEALAMKREELGLTRFLYGISTTCAICFTVVWVFPTRTVSLFGTR